MVFEFQRPPSAGPVTDLAKRRQEFIEKEKERREEVRKKVIHSFREFISRIFMLCAYSEVLPAQLPSTNMDLSNL